MASSETAVLEDVHDPYSWSTSLGSTPPLLTSAACTGSLATFFSDASALSVATEASSHPSGLEALYAQPWVYAGGGLGNIDECSLQTCLAGAGVRRDSITFAAVCVVPECSAFDLAADDFVSTVARVSAGESSVDPPLAQEYVTLLDRIADLNKFLQTGWICGDFTVPWSLVPFGIIFIAVILLLLIFSMVGTLSRQRRNFSKSANNGTVKGAETSNSLEASSSREKVENDGDIGGLLFTNPIWSSFDMSRHVRRLNRQHSTETAVLDGLRVGSISWIMLGHSMAIMSTSGAGYSNPANFLPPHGLTTTVAGQLLFSSRLAVDTFLCISGFLMVHVVDRKMPRRNSRPVVWRYLTNIPSLFFARVVRILPVYAACLGFYTQIAPHLGSGPFWYQWLALLKPCHDYGWTNFLFVNNFVPLDLAITETCFYHSWYLAVDVQLFVVGIFLVFWYQSNSMHGRRVTLSLALLSVLITMYLSYNRRWSVNTFDGAAVARFDVEAYAKPHIRAQAYFAGMYVAMLLPTSVLRQRSSWTWRLHLAMAVALVCMALVTFGTAAGAYARRPCQYTEWPEVDHCGSSWSRNVTFLYTALGRTVWIAGVAVLLYICVGRNSERSLLASVLSWKCWTALSQLSFGAYLIHPIVIFVWQLADRQKEQFRLLTFGMNYLSVCVVSYVLALATALIIEFPCADLWQHFLRNWNRTSPSRNPPIYQSGCEANEIVQLTRSGRYGSLE
ncbi:predicted protein [Phaeodactylum tricornutum CCAP 1055/1]|uniref:Acyltransferase 3 domain-containing protein n=1 Tax=Phaeodactylum tricornutum (strain CCAP 1055/1) TaxID=556484 RepID=B7G9E1_PHATC|nr:predicted protein [Phaeodactylum tricornutum CCAP 1055/1]EEC44942.1 predicted protein [Phaeodactylum tricornutum CCAP 1055/1]|eukprot:XP_002183760.1 predicted protein [Phaeodactylum tricornutum CCAP 1055/1]